TGYYCLV
ncbi:hypothetical protein CAPN004_23140, partial [Capnocytophaga cynodegmi]